MISKAPCWPEAEEPPSGFAPSNSITVNSEPSKAEPPPSVSLKGKVAQRFGGLDDSQRPWSASIHSHGLKSFFKPAIYKEEGVASGIVRSKVFEASSMALILLNCIYIGIATDHNPQHFMLDSDPFFQVAENLFCVMFSLELAIRFMAFRGKLSAIRDGWFVFDAILVMLMIFDTWIVSIYHAAFGGRVGKGTVSKDAWVLRSFRLARLARLSHIVQAFPELSYMTKGMLHSARSVFGTLLLLLVILYAFAIVLTQLSVGTNLSKQYFPTVPHSMLVLFAQAALLDNIAELLLFANEASPICAWIIGFVVLVGALTLMNMLVGILVQVMVRVTEKEKDQVAMDFVSQELQSVLSELALSDGDPLISLQEFEQIVLSETVSKALGKVGIDVVALVDYADFFFQSDNCGEAHETQLTLSSFMDILRQVRGTRKATVTDVLDLRKFISAENSGRNRILREIKDNQQKIWKNQASLENLIQARYS
jgi:hypothetical protein